MLDSSGLVLSCLHGEVWLGKGRAQNTEKIGLLGVNFFCLLYFFSLRATLKGRCLGNTNPRGVPRRVSGLCCGLAVAPAAVVRLGFDLG